MLGTQEKGRIAAALGIYWELFLPSSASATTAGVATTVTSRTAAWATSASATPTITITIATAAGTSVSRTFWTRGTRLYRRHNSIHTVEVRLIVRIEIRAAFDYCRGRALRSAVRH